MRLPAMRALMYLVGAAMLLSGSYLAVSGGLGALSYLSIGSPGNAILELVLFGMGLALDAGGVFVIMAARRYKAGKGTG